MVSTVFVLGIATAVGPVSARENLVILYTANTLGETKPCGCAIENLGGLARRATVIQQERARGKPVLLVDAGDTFLPMPEKQLPNYLRNEALQRGELIFEVYKNLKYDLILTGETDDMAARTLLSENSLGVVEMGGWRISIMQVRAEDITKAPNEVSKHVATVRKRKSGDFLLVLAHLSRQDRGALAKLLTKGDIVITGHEGEHTEDPVSMNGVLFFEPDRRGQYIGRLEIHKEGAVISPKNQIERLRIEEELKLEEDAQRKVMLQDILRKLGRAPKSWFANELIPLNDSIAADPAILKLVEKSK